MVKRGATADSALAGIKSSMDTIRSVLELFKDAKESLPDSTLKASITESLGRADRGIRLGEAQIAQVLGYHLCQCTYPPQIMFGVGLTTLGDERFQCPRCKKLKPPDRAVTGKEAMSRYNDGPLNDYL
ncbi:MAG TPA: hypothetical protein VEU53_02390 [Stellaceae bacterium]|nr:hypothetical protein [Stellaceae bacterium]